MSAPGDAGLAQRSLKPSQPLPKPKARRCGEGARLKWAVRSFLEPGRAALADKNVSSCFTTANRTHLCLQRCSPQGRGETQSSLFHLAAFHGVWTDL